MPVTHGSIQHALSELYTMRDGLVYYTDISDFRVRQMRFRIDRMIGSLKNDLRKERDRLSRQLKVAA